MSSIKPSYVRHLDLKGGRIEMTHGAGGLASAQLIEEIFARHFTKAETGIKESLIQKYWKEND